jgi:hypothetical protein
VVVKRGKVCILAGNRKRKEQLECGSRKVTDNMKINFKEQLEGLILIHLSQYKDNLQQ